MGLEENKSDSFPGVGAVATLPYGKVDCCLYPTRAALAAELQGKGIACTWRAGKLWIGETVEEVQGRCVLGEAEITNVMPVPLVEDGASIVIGYKFGLVDGKVWITNNSSWDASTVKVEQPFWDWSAVSVPFTATRDGLPAPPTKVYVFVEAPCGTRNAVGFETEMMAPVK